MNGFQVTFITVQNHQHGGIPLGEWLLLEAKELGIKGGTLLGAAEGFGHKGKLHSQHFFELADQPIEVTFAVSAEECSALFQKLQRENVNVFYVKIPIEYGQSMKP